MAVARPSMCPRVSESGGGVPVGRTTMAVAHVGNVSPLRPETLQGRRDAGTVNMIYYFANIPVGRVLLENITSRDHQEHTSRYLQDILCRAHKIPIGK
jgi:hypothetical protein